MAQEIPRSGNSRRSRLGSRWFMWLLIPSLGGCVCCPPTMFNGCVNFESLSVGTRYEFQDTFTDAGAMITVEAFQWGNGTWTNGNYAQVDNRLRAGGSGLDMQYNNVNLRFDFGALGLNGLSMVFGEYGGNLNLQVNGEFRNFENFAMLNGSILGGAGVSVSGGTGNDTGNITISGKVQSFAIGGQELWIDDVCAR